jgi:hypothetical protein
MHRGAELDLRGLVRRARDRHPAEIGDEVVLREALTFADGAS